MNPPQLSAVLVLMLAQLCASSLGCPSGCRCYSLTVECGSIGLKEIPRGITHGTQVSDHTRDVNICGWVILKYDNDLKLQINS